MEILQRINDLHNSKAIYKSGVNDIVKETVKRLCVDQAFTDGRFYLFCIYFFSNKDDFPKIWDHPAHKTQVLLTQHFYPSDESVPRINSYLI